MHVNSSRLQSQPRSSAIHAGLPRLASQMIKNGDCLQMFQMPEAFLRKSHLASQSKLSSFDGSRTLLKFRHVVSILFPHSLFIDLSSCSLWKLLISHEDVLHFWHLELGQQACCMLVDFLGG